MIILRTTAITLDILFALLVMYFMHKLSWQKEEERPSIIGFAVMIVAYLLNGALIAFL